MIPKNRLCEVIAAVVQPHSIACSLRSVIRALALSAIVTLLLIGSGCESVINRAAPLPVHHEKLGDKLVTAVNLRAQDGVFLQSSNKLSLTAQVPVNTPAQITEFRSDGVDILIQHVSYRMTPASGKFDDSRDGVETFLEKYFAPVASPVQLDTLGPAELTPAVQVGRVHKGMTKEQIFVALGPPKSIDDPSHETVRLSKKRIFESDQWSYVDDYISIVPTFKTYTFADGVLHSVD